MLNYTYIQENTITGKSKNEIIIGISKRTDIILVIQYNLLKCKRNSRYTKLFSDFDGDMEDIESVKEYLPIQYKKYVHDLKLLKSRLVSFIDIIKQYKIYDIKIAP